MTDAAPTEREPLRVPVRIKVYGGALGLLPPGTEWRVTRTTEHVAPGGLIGEVMPKWTIIDLAPCEAAGAATETGGLPSVDRIYELLWHERDRLDAGISGFNEVLYRRAARYIASGLASGADREDGEAT